MGSNLHPDEVFLVERERETEGGSPLTPSSMAPAGKVSGFHREGNDWYSFISNICFTHRYVQTPLRKCFSFHKTVVPFQTGFETRFCDF